ncbi:MAG: hypothetical protein ACR2PR_00645 [Pseudohongiellaceae bacterium]
MNKMMELLKLYGFEGPYPDFSKLKDESGLYVVLGRNDNDSDWNMIDVGKSKALKSRLEGHNRKSCWKDQGFNKLAYSVCYIFLEVDYEPIEKMIRDEFNPPCGEE